MRWLFAIVFLGFNSAYAETLPDLETVLADLSGTEVQATGQIGNFDSYGPHLAIKESLFGVTYALPREKLKRVELCEFGSFSRNSGCEVVVSGELRMKGNKVEILVFDISFVD